MGANSKIEWTHHTFNPWWGCAAVSAGCKNCYAERLAARAGVGWGRGAARRPTSEKLWNEPLRWDREALKAGERRRVFCASMADVFDPEAREEWRQRLWDLIRATPNLDWLLLTKRPEEILRRLPLEWGEGWPNVWMGVSAEDQKNLDARVRLLLQVPAAVRFVSAEPLLGPLDLDVLLGPIPEDEDGAPYVGHLNWVIVGGESGPGARPFHLDWARRVVKQCRAAETAVFVKQLGAKAQGDPPGKRSFLDAHVVWYLSLKDRKGGDPEEWPVDLRVREFPRPR